MSFISALKKHSIALALSLIFLIALSIRLAYFGDATFGYDQARDAFVAMGIFGDDPIKIQGPATDIKGLFHGSLYWYLIAPFYLLFRGDPQGPRIFLIILNILNIPFIYFFTKQLFGKTPVALISAFIFAVSFEAVQYGRWLSNPGPALLSIAVFYYGAWLTFHRKPVGIGLMLLGGAISMQFEFFLVYLSLFFVFVTGYYLLKTSIKTLFTRTNALLAGLAVLFYVSFVVSEIKFRFQATHAITGFFSKAGKETQNPAFVIQKLNRFVESLVANVSYNIIDFSHTVTTAVAIFIAGFIIWRIVKWKKERGKIIFLSFWLVSPGLFYVFEKNNSYFLNIGNIYPLIMLTSFIIFTFIKQLPKILKVFTLGLILGVVTISNLNLVIKNNKNGESLFSVQNKMNLSDEKDAIDWMYKQSNGKEFSVNAVTNPLFVHTNWAYLFDWYGKKQYGFMPMWLGYPLDGNFGDKVVFGKENMYSGLTHFLIIEPETGIPNEYVVAYKGYEDARSKVVESRKIGEFTVQKRVLIKRSHFLRQDLLHYLPNQHSLPADFWENN